MVEVVSSQSSSCPCNQKVVHRPKPFQLGLHNHPHLHLDTKLKKLVSRDPHHQLNHRNRCPCHLNLWGVRIVRDRVITIISIGHKSRWLFTGSNRTNDCAKTISIKIWKPERCIRWVSSISPSQSSSRSLHCSPASGNTSASPSSQSFQITRHIPSLVRRL